jgi:CBS domain containing-hemolysin-like protein
VPLAVVVVGLRPLVALVQGVSRLVKPRSRVFAAPEEEVRQMAMLSAEEGSILPFEAELVENVLALDKVTARDIMTPRPVVFKLPGDMTVREVAREVPEWTYSRIPIYSPRDPEAWVGFVFSRTILQRLAKDDFDVTLKELSQPLYFVSDKTQGHILLKTFLRRRVHIFGVMDAFGDLVGVVTLEDVLEALIGEEIVDEVDVAVDLQAVARLRSRQRFGEDSRS